MVPDPFILKNFYIAEKVQTETKMMCFFFFNPYPTGWAFSGADNVRDDGLCAWLLVDVLEPFLQSIFFDPGILILKFLLVKQS